MKITGTKHAFSLILGEKNVYRKLGLDRSTISTYKAYLRDGRNISQDKMEELLQRYGATLEQEKVWDVPFDLANGQSDGATSSTE